MKLVNTLFHSEFRRTWKQSQRLRNSCWTNVTFCFRAAVCNCCPQSQRGFPPEPVYCTSLTLHLHSCALIVLIQLNGRQHGSAASSFNSASGSWNHFLSFAVLHRCTSGLKHPPVDMLSFSLLFCLKSCLWRCATRWKAQTNDLFSNRTDANHIEGSDKQRTLVTHWSLCNLGNLWKKKKWIGARQTNFNIWQAGEWRKWTASK